MLNRSNTDWKQFSDDAQNCSPYH